MIVYTLSIILLGAVIVYVFLTPGGRVIQPIPRWQYVSGDTFVHGNDL